MAQSLVGVGTVANDGTGDPLRTAYIKLNSNDTELYGFLDREIKTIVKNSHGFVTGNVLYIDGTGTIQKITNATTQTPVGIVQVVIDANTFQMVEGGYVSGLSGLVAGTTYYVQNSGVLGTTVIAGPYLVADTTGSGYLLSGSSGGSSAPSWLLSGGGTLSAANTIIGTTTNTIQFQFATLATTQTNGAGLWLQNPTAASAGAQQISPSLTLEGQGWKTTSTAASQSVKFTQYVTPVQGAANPTGGWGLYSSINAGAYSQVLNVDNSGNIQAYNTYSLGTLGYTDTGILVQLQSSTNSFNQQIIQNTNSGAVGSTNYIVSNNLGTATTFYGEFGMNSSGFTGSGAFNLPSAVYLDSTSADLAIGTTTSNAIHFVINYGTTDALTINTSSQLVVPAFSTAGVVHNSAAGILSSSLIVAADIGTNVAWLVGGNTLTGNAIFGDISGTGYQISIQTKGLSRYIIDSNGNQTFQQSAQSVSNTFQTFTQSAHTGGTGVSIKGLLWTGGAHLANLASTESIDWDINLARQVQWAAGTTVTQRQIYVRGVTLTGVSATATFTDTFSFYVDPPLVGTNAAITRAWAAGFNGNVWAGNQIMVAPSGTSFVSGEFISVQASQNSNLNVLIKNSQASGTANYGSFQVTDQSNKTLSMGQVGNGFTSSGIDVANTTVIKSNSGAGFNIGLTSNVPFAFWTSGVERATFLGSGEFLIGYTAAIASELSGVSKNQNASTKFIVSNTTSGTAGTSQLGVLITGGSGIQLSALSAGFTTSGIFVANTSAINSGLTGGLNVGTTNASQASIWTNNIQRLGIDSSGLFTYTQSAQAVTNTFQTFTQAVHTGGTPSGLLWTGGAHTTIAASEAPDWNLNFARTVQFTSNVGFATQRVVRFQGPTYAFVSATGTITNAYTVSIDAAPAAGTNAVITNTWALGLGGALQLFAGTTTMPPLVFQSGTNSTTIINGAVEFNGTHLTVGISGARVQLDNQVIASGWLAGGATTITANTSQTGAFSNTFSFNNIIISPNAQTGTVPAGLSYVGLNHTAMTASTEFNDVYINTARNIQFNTGSLALQRTVYIGGISLAFVGASTVTDAASLGINSSPYGGTNATITNSHAILVSAGPLIGTVTNSYGITVNAQTGATNNYAAKFLGGNVGIGLSTPIATLHVSGSIAHKTTTSAAASLTLDKTATTWVFTGSSATTWTLPALSGNTDLTYFVFNRGSAAITLQRAGSDNLYTTTSVTSVTVNAGSAYMIQNDGSFWLVFTV